MKIKCFKMAIKEEVAKLGLEYERHDICVFFIIRNIISILSYRTLVHEDYFLVRTKVISIRTQEPLVSQAGELDKYSSANLSIRSEGKRGRSCIL